jgi:hypothetical protein
MLESYHYDEEFLGLASVIILCQDNPCKQY